MQHLFIINPAAGKANSALSLRPAIEKAFGEELTAGSCRILLTEKPFDAAHFAKEAAEHIPDGETLRIYSCGGDGTLCEIVNGIIGCPNTEVAVLPCGSGNDFIKSLPCSDRALFLDPAAQKAGESFLCDAIRVDDQYSVNLASAGFDANVAYHMNKFKRLPLVSGPMAYIISILFCLLSRMSRDVTVTVDDKEVIRQKTLLAALCNGGWYGGSFNPAPFAVMDDGLLEFILVKKIPRYQFLKLIGRYKDGSYVGKPEYEKILTLKKCRKVKLHSETPICVNVDGECGPTNDITFEIVPRALHIVIPKAPAGSEAEKSAAAAAK